MTTLQEDDDDGFKKQFSQFIKNGVTSESVSISYIYVHQSLRNVSKYVIPLEKCVHVLHRVHLA
jgi:hypothetical protein